MIGCVFPISTSSFERTGSWPDPSIFTLPSLFLTFCWGWPPALSSCWRRGVSCLIWSIKSWILIHSWAAWLFCPSWGLIGSGSGGHGAGGMGHGWARVRRLEYIWRLVVTVSISCRSSFILSLFFHFLSSLFSLSLFLSPYRISLSLSISLSKAGSLVGGGGHSRSADCRDGKSNGGQGEKEEGLEGVVCVCVSDIVCLFVFECVFVILFVYECVFCWCLGVCDCVFVRGCLRVLVLGCVDAYGCLCAWLSFKLICVWACVWMPMLMFVHVCVFWVCECGCSGMLIDVRVCLIVWMWAWLAQGGDLGW